MSDSPIYLQDSRKTCDTDFGYLEFKENEFLPTIKAKPPHFLNTQTKEVSKIKSSNLIEKPFKLSEKLLEPFKENYEFILSEINEDYSHHFLPNPCFIHPGSMDIPTPKCAFSPNKPRYLNSFKLH